jgi:hypothetical protein
MRGVRREKPEKLVAKLSGSEISTWHLSRDVATQILRWCKVANVQFKDHPLSLPPLSHRNRKF